MTSAIAAQLRPAPDLGAPHASGKRLRGADAPITRVWNAMRNGLAAVSYMGFPCLQLHETRELTLRIEEEGRKAKETSHAGIIRIGF
jgi:hypothetical protein